VNRANLEEAMHKSKLSGFIIGRPIVV